MKFNQWTLGLAALGVVSLASAAKAEEKMSVVQSALSSTTISGYVDTSMHWNPGDGNRVVAPVSFNGPGKSDGFNLNVVQLTIAKALDESEWASGYRADFWMGPDAGDLGTQSIFSSGDQASSSDFAIRQAYVALRAPVGNGLDFKVGVFDTIIGYETLESGNNPNYTHSYGFTLEPTTHTGVLATYRFNDSISVSGGIANTVGPSINERAQGPNSSGGNTDPMAESYKAYMASVALTAPSDWGWAAGSTLYAGILNGWSSGAEDAQMNLYLGATLATPVTGLKVGASFDFVQLDEYNSDSDTVWAAALYASYQATEKLSLHARGEYLKGEDPTQDLEVYALTGTVQYDLWENVISRLEIRWDHCADGPNDGQIFGGSTYSGEASDWPDTYYNPKGSAASSYYNPPSRSDYHSDSSAVESLFSGASAGVANPNANENAVLIALQFIYKF